MEKKGTSRTHGISKTTGIINLNGDFNQSKNMKMLRSEEQKLEVRKLRIKRELAAITIQLWWRKILR